MAARKQYTREFKQDAVRVVIAQGYTQSEAARNLGIDRGMLARWVKECREDEGEAFRGNGKLTSEQEEVRRRREENRRLQRERDILKKATACFAQESRGEFSLLAKREEGLSGEHALPNIGREPQWILRLPAASGSGSRPGA